MKKNINLNTFQTYPHIETLLPCGSSFKDSMSTMSANISSFLKSFVTVGTSYI